MSLAHAEAPGEAASAPVIDLEAVFARHRAAFLAEPAPGLAARRAHLSKLEKAVLANQDAIAEAISADFGHRSRHETLLAEIFVTVEGIRHARRNLRRWMRPRRRGVSWAFLPGRAKVVCQPLGVVGIIAPWNYPFQLAVAPLAEALAAGNRVMIKPSEFAPETANCLARLIAETFDRDHVTVVNGGTEVGAAFTTLPFDHLLFTGSTGIGAKVMAAAAPNLTPVTLELGGKSPAIVAPDYPLGDAATKIMMGKLLNAGQTCIAPDYVLVPEDKLDAFAAAAKAAVAKLYPTLATNPDYTSIINERHYQRLTGLVDEARAGGARIDEINPAAEVLVAEERKMAPVLVVGAGDETGVMRDEIFGPVLPLVPYRDLDEAIAYVNARPRPLALYHFDHDGGRVDKVLERTTAGGVTVNDTLLHIAQSALPFGGVGPSGMGAYHGREGFETFSHKKAVFRQSRLSGSAMLFPPYGKLAEFMLKLLIRK
jgi:coniferyl-aldehyde dehydrogenase